MLPARMARNSAVWMSCHTRTSTLGTPGIRKSGSVQAAICQNSRMAAMAISMASLRAAGERRRFLLMDSRQGMAGHQGNPARPSVCFRRGCHYRTRPPRASQLASLLPIQVDDGLHIVGLSVLGLQGALGLHDVGDFLHPRQILRRQRGAEGLGLDRLADDLL